MNFFYNIIKIGIRSWIMIILNLMLIFVVGIISVTFYAQFKEVLDERMMLQLTSIKKLKRIQIEKYINREKAEFLASGYSSFPYIPANNSVLDSVAKYATHSGLVDATCHTLDSSPQLVLIKVIKDNKFIKPINQARIQEILLERTGMGDTGETYLVGEDYKLRSRSRFFPSVPAYKIEAKTENVQKALAGISNHSITKDYREVEVYSAFHLLEVEGIDWVILSEIDVEEVVAPLLVLRNKLILISFLVVCFSVIISYFISRSLSKPLVQIRSNLFGMSEGDYDIKVSDNSILIEFNETIEALNSLRNSLLGAIYFSNEIGKMNLQFSYHPKSEKDVLGSSLVKMRDKLIEFQKKIDKEELKSKRLFVKGQENERSRLSKEIHDGIGPLLTVLRLTILSIDITKEQKEKLKNLIDETISESRRISNDLMPSLLLDFGLKQALMNFIQTVSAKTKSEIIFSNSVESLIKISKEVEIAIFRICQELLNNAIKHSEAKKIKIDLREFSHKIELQYNDNGVGFDVKKKKKGSGLNNIQERIKIINGDLSIVSSFGGTNILIEIPR